MSHFSSRRSMWATAFAAAALALGCGGTTVDVLPDASTKDTSPVDLGPTDDSTPPPDLGGMVDATPPPRDSGGAFCDTARCMDGMRCCETLRMCQPAGVFCPTDPPPPMDGGTIDASPGTCGTNAECRAGQYCAGMGCGTRGACAARPEVCPTIFAPVCGCDGNTYENECRAAGAGIRVASAGMCSTGTFCSRALCAPTTPRCCEALMRCIGATETCPGDPPTDGGPATCRSDRDCAAGQSCCAGTGRCYPSACLSCCMVVPPVDAGVDVPVTTRCSATADCGRGRECVYPDNACVRDGVCMDAIACLRPETFCSCASVTYTGCRPDRPTMARAACPTPMCRSNADCGRGQYCAGAGCGTPGTCAARGEVCPAVVDPVCGCDGRTYGNSCEAAVAGVRVASRGACAPTSFCATVLCVTGTFCCESLRMCVRTGTACPGTDAGVVDAGPAVCRSDRDCTTGQSCCTATGRCYDPRCLSCCMPTVDAGPVDAGPAACRSNTDCGRGQYCAGTGCGTAGTCAATPTACPDIFSPVCGCDGRTYGNSCEAATAGVRVASTGACSVRCTVTADCGRGRECVYPDNACVRDGVCMDAIACLRPETFCSCANVTYMSCRPDRPTMARAACPPPTCRSNSDCSATQYCAATGCDTAGTCQTRPMACITLFDPVCGCDGRTYSNSCTAAAAGVRVASRGECAPTSFCAMVRCAAGNFCCETTRACIPFGTACSTTGTCTSDTQCGGTPYGCCASSGRCYDTRCLSCCMPRPGTCRTNADCTAAQYCAGSGCETAGTCTTRPTICTRELNPQCGCDRRTYSNPCVAAAAGVRVASAGACP